LLLTQALPRLPARRVRRPRLERRLAADATLPVRLIVGPPGSGKTTLALACVAEAPIGAYCALPPDCSAEDFVVALAQALDLAEPPKNYAELLVVLRRLASQPLELVIDDLDHARSDARVLASKLIDDLPQNVSLIYCARGRDAVDAKQWISRGLGSLCDARRLAFDATELASLCDAHGVPYSNADVARLLEESDGWAIVIGGAVRAASEDERSLSDAYERWRMRYGEVFLDFILGELEDAESEDVAIVQALIQGRGVDDRSALHRLEARGLFVYNDGGVMRPFKALQHARAIPIHNVDTSIPMVVRMLGRFSVSIQGREVEWVRRRDQQIVKYLLLRQGASATRTELAATFWPRVEKQLAAQSVRTACSNIRKAIASVVGYARVERYFRASTTITIDLSSVVTDVGRFTAHAMAGDGSYDAAKFDDAVLHYLAAEKIYSGRLYDEDAIEPWFAQNAHALEDRLGVILERLAEDAYGKGDLKHAAEYAYRAKLIRPEQPGVLRLLSRLKGQQHSA
jgi:DNA-binding SARP family transcriptional activator